MKTNYLNYTVMAILAIGWIAIGTSCNTVRGVGKDVESTGEHIQRSTH